MNLRRRIGEQLKKRPGEIEMSAKDGGTAFPEITHIQTPHSVSWQTPEWSQVRTSGGMSLRDWFAGQALAGLLANPEETRSMSKSTPADQIAINAEAAYLLADAMLKERKP